MFFITTFAKILFSFNYSQRLIFVIHVITFECWINDNLLREVLVLMLVLDCKLLLIEVRVVEPVVDALWYR